jgi:subtilisin-like proprotein convertase family protein
MFASCRAILPNSNLIGAWNFDGNLRNFASSTTETDGSFNTGGVNECRISGYINDSITGPAPNVQYEACPTVLNCTGFPLGFFKKTVNKSIYGTPPVYDTINVTGFSGNLNKIQVFLAIQHRIASHLVVSLKAPNGTSVILSSGKGETSVNGYLTVLDDSIANGVDSYLYFPPWTNYAKPQNTMGTFGNTPVNGRWILRVDDNHAGNTGFVVGWGVRFNNSYNVGIQNTSDIVPDKFQLFQNYPNPFNPVTKIKFSISASTLSFPNVSIGNPLVMLKVFDILGREIATLVNEKLKPGTYNVDWDASAYSSGVYFYKLTCGDFSETKKMTLIK